MLYRIRPFGDSITAGYGFGFGCKPQPHDPHPISCWPPNEVGGGYRAFLAGNTPNKLPMLMVGGRHDNSAMWMWQVGQQNHDGYASHTMAQLMPYARQSRPSEVILLHVGTNDILTGSNGAQAADALRELLITLLMTNSTTRILVAQIIPEFKYGKEAEILDYNSRVPGIVDLFKPWGRDLRVVDMHPGMTSQDYMDGLHPNFAGYEKMASRWRAAINTLPELAQAAIPGEGVGHIGMAS